MKITNSIEINKNIDYVFDKTNDIDSWVKLFSEYKESEVLARKDNILVFRLKNLQDNEWISWREINKDNYSITAKRLYPLYPFETMDLHWKYIELSNNKTEMTWVQEFIPHKEFPREEKEMYEFLNKNTQQQQQIIKEKLEKS